MSDGKDGGIVLFAAAILMVVVGALGFRMLSVYDSPPRIVIDNQSGVELRDLVLEGAGYKEQVDRVPAHSSTSVTVHPKGKAGPRISFQVGSATHSADVSAYIEQKGGYVLTITVDPDLAIHSDKGRMMVLW